MSTLGVNSPLIMCVGKLNSIGIVDDDIVYEGAMVGMVEGEGYGRPLVAGDKFLGHSIDKIDNTGGSDDALKIQVISGKYRAVVDLVGTITDLGQPVYASDDAVVTFLSTSNSYVGRISRYVSATKMEVEFDTLSEGDDFDPNANRVTKAAGYSPDNEDSGLIINVTVSAVITLPTSVLGWEITVVNAGPYGTVQPVVDFPSNVDLSRGGCGLAAGGAGLQILNTLATAQRGDYIKLVGDGNGGYSVVGLRGTWVNE